MRNAEAWRRNAIYRAILKIAKRKCIGLPLQKGLKYAIGQKKFEILFHLEKHFEYNDDQSESQQCIYFYDLKEELFSIKRKLREEKRFNLLHPVVKTTMLWLLLF